MTRQIRRHLATTWTRYTPRETAWPATPASVTLPQPVPCLASNAAHRRSSLPSACCCRFEIEISPSRSIPDTHVSLLLFSLSLFSPLSFSFSFFFFFNFVHSILDTGRGEDMRVPPCRDIGLFSKSSPPPPTAAILSNMKFLTPRVRVFDHAPPG